MTVKYITSSPLVAYLRLIEDWCETLPNPLVEPFCEETETSVQSFSRFLSERGYIALANEVMKDWQPVVSGSHFESEASRSRTEARAQTIPVPYHLASGASGALDSNAALRSGTQNGGFMKQHGNRTVPKIPGKNLSPKGLHVKT